MALAILLTIEPRIGVVLVDSLPVEIRQPRFDVSRWHENRHPLVTLASRKASIHTGVLNLVDPRGNFSPVGVDQDHQRLFNPVRSCSVVGEFLCKSLRYELLARSAAFGVDFDPLNSDRFACAGQEPPGKSLVLPVFAKDHHLDVAAHGSHPLAMDSDSFKPPSTAISLTGRTTVTPELSRFSASPRSPPR